MPGRLTTFDATSREACTVKRTRTNTPMQALALMNATIYIEAARALTLRMMAQGGDDTHQRIGHGFRLVLGRVPDARETNLLAQASQRYRTRFANDTEEAAKLLAIGESKAPEDLDPADLAACTLVASLILNLDETVTRQ